MKTRRQEGKPAYRLEKESVKDEIDTGLEIGMTSLMNQICGEKPDERFHNTKYLLQQYRRISYAVKVSEAELNMRMELEHGMQLSTLEINAELVGVDLEGTKLERYSQRMKPPVREILTVQ